MKLIEFFGVKVKPRLTKGKQMFKPIENGRISERVYAIRDKDVNCFLIRTENGYIALDSGYKASLNVKKGLEELNIDPNTVKAVFLTHLDLDHAGGCDIKAGEIFKKAEIFLSEPEAKYLTKEVYRKKIGPFKLSMPVKLRDNIHLLKDGQKINIDGVNVEIIYAPGHTFGHSAYIIDNVLFIGDALISNGKAGYCFYDFWNMDSLENSKSLLKLETICKVRRIPIVVTSHSGFIETKKAFIFKDVSPNWRRANFTFIKDAPIDAFK